MRKSSEAAPAETAVPSPFRDETDPETMVSPRELRFDEGRSLRATAARGTIINGAFLAGLSLLGMLKGFAVAALLSVDDYGVWGFLAAVLTSLLWLRQVGIVDKFIQQDESDQELAFQKAFTLEAIVTGVFVVVMLAAIPLLGRLYGQAEIVAPGLVLAAAVPAIVLQAPLWIFLRQMQFLKQRALQSINPLVSLVVTIALAVTGFGYWSLVIGLVVGNWAAAAAAVIASPYRLRLRFDAATARRYVSFSWPLFVAGVSIVAMGLVPVLVAAKTLGLTGVGAIALANLIPIWARRASDVVTQTMYPGVCAVKDRSDLLLEAFTKSNRFGILWGAPVGAGLALFAPQLVEFVLGSKWEFAVGLLQAMGVITAVNQFAFNWTAFFRATGRTRPIAAASVVQAATICGIAVPLMVIGGLGGFALGMGIVTAIYLLVRIHYLLQFFPQLSMLGHALPAFAPTVAGAIAVLGARAAFGADAGIGQAIGELSLYALTVLTVTLLTSGPLVREAIGYVRNRQPQPRAA